jgi:hypothetical protein
MKVTQDRPYGTRTSSQYSPIQLYNVQHFVTSWHAPLKHSTYLGLLKA